MSKWRYLDIEVTTDLKKIKNAYSSMLKKYHPEDDPEGFMKLRDEYEAATKYAKNYNNRDKSTSKSFYTIDELEFQENKNDYIDADFKHRKNIENEYKDDNEYKPKSLILNNLKKKLLIIEDNRDINLNNNSINSSNELLKLYNDIFRRKDINEWKTFFVSLKITEINFIKESGFFTNKKHFPLEIWNFIKSKLFLEDMYEYEQANYLDLDHKLSYKYFDSTINCDYEKYLDFRLKALDAFLNCNFDNVFKYVNIAIKIYDKDASIYRILALTHFLNKDYNKALNNFIKILSIDEFYNEAILYKGICYYILKKYNLGIIELKKYLSLDKDNYEAKLWLLKCEYKICKDIDKIKYQISELKKEQQENLELNIINTEIKEKSILRSIYHKINFWKLLYIVITIRFITYLICLGLLYIIVKIIKKFIIFSYESEREYISSNTRNTLWVLILSLFSDIGMEYRNKKIFKNYKKKWKKILNNKGKIFNDLLFGMKSIDEFIENRKYKTVYNIEDSKSFYTALDNYKINPDILEKEKKFNLLKLKLLILDSKSKKIFIEQNNYNDNMLSFAKLYGKSLSGSFIDAFFICNQIDILKFGAFKKYISKNELIDNLNK
ncbi:MAG: hypothetical protein ABF289_02145, partial [Clostridiales bacterium]